MNFSQLFLIRITLILSLLASFRLDDACSSVVRKRVKFDILQCKSLWYTSEYFIIIIYICVNETQLFWRKIAVVLRLISTKTLKIKSGIRAVYLHTTQPAPQYCPVTLQFS